MKRTATRKPMRLTESKLRQIIRSILLEGGIPQLSDFPADQYKKEEVERLNSYWVKVKPALEFVGFKPKQDPFDFSAVQAAKLLGCRPDQLLIYLPEDDFERYDEDTAMMYADAYLAKVDPGYTGENMNGYVLLDVIVPGAAESITQRYIYTCEKQSKTKQKQSKTKPKQTIKNKNLRRIK